MRKLATLAAVALLGGCVGVGSGDFAYDGGSALTAEPRPVVSGFDDDEPFISFGARGGVVMYLAADEAVTPRLTVGAYGRMLESDTGRLEAAIELTPDLQNMDRQNLYLMLAADYVGFVSDMLYWKAGGGGIIETQGSKNFFILTIEGGMGMWFPVGEDEDAGTAAVANLMLQLPISVTGGTANAKMALAITGGYEF